MTEHLPGQLPLPSDAPYGPLIDIGVNLTDASFRDDLEAVLGRAGAAGVRHQLVTGTDLPHSQRALELARAHGDVLATTAGVHPHHAKDVAGDWPATLLDLLAEDSVRAVGETGLDFNRDFSPRPDQERVFLRQLELAVETGLPLFLHERDTRGRLFELLAPFRDQVHGVLHCFTGSESDLERALEFGLHIGITGWICDERRGAELQRLAPRIPDERLLIETDAPYLLPRTVRPRRKSRRNEPALLPWVVAELARCRQQDPGVIAAHSTANACALFGFPY